MPTDYAHFSMRYFLTVSSGPNVVLAIYPTA